MLNSVYAAQHPHRFIYRGYEVQTNGNDLAHTVLRGATSKHGRNIPNYHYEDLQILLGLYNERDLKTPPALSIPTIPTPISSLTSRFESSKR